MLFVGVLRLGACFFWYSTWHVDPVDCYQGMGSCLMEMLECADSLACWWQFDDSLRKHGNPLGDCFFGLLECIVCETQCVCFVSAWLAHGGTQRARPCLGQPFICVLAGRAPGKLERKKTRELVKGL